MLSVSCRRLWCFLEDFQMSEGKLTSPATRKSRRRPPPTSWAESGFISPSRQCQRARVSPGLALVVRCCSPVTDAKSQWPPVHPRKKGTSSSDLRDEALGQHNRGYFMENQILDRWPYWQIEGQGHGKPGRLIGERRADGRERLQSSTARFTANPTNSLQEIRKLHTMPNVHRTYGC